MHTNPHKPSRWWIAAAGTLLQLCLGTVYAWSYLTKPLMQTYGWSNTQVTWVFSLAICCLGLAAAWGGMNLARIGPRRLAVAGGLMFGCGYLLAALALHLKSLPLLYAGYGVCGGIGLGLGYVTPVATAARWFPDKKGLVTGMVIMGFGFGALLMSKLLMPMLMADDGSNLAAVFVWLGTAFGVITVACGLVLRNPPDDPQTPDKSGSHTSAQAADLTLREHLLSSRFLIIWGVFFCNITAGIAIIGFLSPMMQDLLKRTNPDLTAASLTASGATLIAIGSVCNGIGRFFWGGISDRIGRMPAFRVILATQIAAFLVLATVALPWVFVPLVCYALLCYGGGFGTMPALVLDVFGARLMPVVYGTVLTAWSAGGIVGPQIVAGLKDHYGAQRAASLSFFVGAALLTVGLILSLRLSNDATSGSRAAPK